MLGDYLKSTFLIDITSNNIERKARELKKEVESNQDLVIKTFEFVRDHIEYRIETFQIQDKSKYKASYVLETKKGFCIPKATLLTALLRANSIPSRLHFADIINHRSPQHLVEVMGTNLYVFHGYVEVFLEGKWIKLNPAFDSALCERLGLPICHFNGFNDAIFATIDLKGDKFVEYVKDRGIYDEVPFDEIIEAMSKFYSHLLN